jgi:hypothetical protein
MTRRFRLLLVLLGALLVLGPRASLADGPAPQVNTDQAVKDGTSRDDFKQGPAVNQDKWHVESKPSGPMAQILAAVMERLNGYKSGNPCKDTAVSAAWYAVADGYYAGQIGGFEDAILGALSKIKDIATFGADPSEAADTVEAGKLVDEYVKTLRDEGLDRVKDKLKELWSGAKKEVYKSDWDQGNCHAQLISIWDPQAGTFEVTVFGNCDCNYGPAPEAFGRPARLKAFAVRVEGVIEPAKEHGNWVFVVRPRSVTVNAPCGCTTNSNSSQTAPTPTPEPPPPPTPPQGDGWSKVKTDCAACQPIVDKIHDLAQQRVDMERDFRTAATILQAAQSRLKTAQTDAQKSEAAKDVADATADFDKLSAKEGAIILLQQKLWRELQQCEKEKCHHAMACPPRHEDGELALGPNSAVGSGARTRQKLASTALGLVGGLIGGGGGGGSDEGPQLASCRIKDSQMTVFSDPESGVALQVGAARSRGEVVVFANILKSPDSGTFHSAKLRNDQDQELRPADVQICKLWGEWSLSVSWTRTTYVNNQMVSRESGGWSRSGDFSLPGQVSGGQEQGIWRRLGFSNASHGAREVAMSFKASPEALGSGVDLVMHVTRPGRDPVTTVPFALRMTETPGGFRFERAGVCPAPAQGAG